MVIAGRSVGTAVGLGSHGIALPPIIRIAGHGIRTVSETTIEATDSSGQTAWQRLTATSRYRVSREAVLR